MDLKGYIQRIISNFLMTHKKVTFAIVIAIILFAIFS